MRQAKSTSAVSGVAYTERTVQITLANYTEPIPNNDRIGI